MLSNRVSTELRAKGALHHWSSTKAEMRTFRIDECVLFKFAPVKKNVEKIHESWKTAIPTSSNSCINYKARPGTHNSRSIHPNWHCWCMAWHWLFCRLLFVDVMLNGGEQMSPRALFVRKTYLPTVGNASGFSWNSSVVDFENLWLFNSL